MKKLFELILFMTIANFSISQDSLLPTPILKIDTTTTQPYKKYFFEGVDFIKENKELVVIVKDPQTQFARNFRPQMYNDSSFLDLIQKEFNVVYPDEPELLHMCGHDVFFYIKSGTNLKLFKQINSKCSSDADILYVLNNNGITLKVDTLYSLDYQKNEYQYFINDDFIYGNYVTLENNSELWQNSELEDRDLNLSEIYNNCSYYPSMYDGSFTLNLDVDTSKTVTQNLIDFFLSYQIDSLEFRKINFELVNKWDVRFSNFFNPPVYPRKTTLSIKIYIDAEYFETFKEFGIINRKESEKRVYELRKDEPLLIIHR